MTSDTVYILGLVGGIVLFTLGAVAERYFHNRYECRR